MSVLHRVNCYLRETGMPPTVFGRRAINDPRLVQDLNNGRELRPGTVRRIEAFIEGSRRSAAGIEGSRRSVAGIAESRK